jgi:hypothetical protein
MDKEEFQPKNHQKSIPSLKGGNKFKPDRRFFEAHKIRLD